MKNRFYFWNNPLSLIAVMVVILCFSPLNSYGNSAYNIDSSLLNKTKSLKMLEEKVGKQKKGIFQFNRLSLPEFLNMFGSEYGVNIVNNAENVSNRISVSLKDIHPVDLFDTVIATWECDWYILKGIIHIVKRDPVRVYKLNFIEAKLVLETITSVTTLRGLTIHQSNNMVLARGKPDQLDLLDSIVKELDVPPLQVLIEAKILETTLDKSDLLGFNFSQTDADGFNGKSIHTAGYDATSENTIRSGMFFKVVEGSFLGEIDAQHKDSNTNILANPKLLVTNHTKASIVTGQRLGFTTNTQVDKTTVETVNFLDTGIRLEFTPHISDNGRIIMDIFPEVSEGRIENNIPRETTTKTSTRVMVTDGETIVIGGLIQKKTVDSVTGVPILSDIPLLNMLFQKTESADSKREILILITPHIVNPTGSDVSLPVQEEAS